MKQSSNEKFYFKFHTRVSNIQWQSSGTQNTIQNILLKIFAPL